MAAFKAVETNQGSCNLNTHDASLIFKPPEKMPVKHIKDHRDLEAAMNGPSLIAYRHRKCNEYIWIFEGISNEPGSDGVTFYQCDAWPNEGKHPNRRPTEHFTEFLGFRPSGNPRPILPRLSFRDESTNIIRNELRGLIQQIKN